ncbi:glycosyltransferase [Methylobacterium sp. J-077]|uniref:glycosyltransferase n=1 Tax=Methylobacterium sp. J-077 TaxID=2836656 RepID=UPI001FBABAA3|nr:glycosyltransferase [Methylobacterium sp. J-077]MCJ2126406.1 glycosyltransferase [Methylobacterium sp. J-077]
MSAPRHTIIVPTYNQAQYLGAALDSILVQTDPSWEAIVVNDGSTDGTAAIIDAYAAKDSRFIAVHKPNGGVGSALNAGLGRATGSWIHWLSSDDMFEPDKLAINNRWIETHPDCRFFFSYFTLLRDATGELERRELWGPVPEPELQVLAMFYRNCISGISICVSREAWRAAGHFDETLRYAQDFDQWLRLLRNNKAVFIPEWTVINRNHALQGSEVFPDACYFETALASIRFINQHRLQQLAPWADLSDVGMARAVVTSALNTAFERSSYLYCLGPHPALVLRVLEWIDSAGTPSAAALRLEVIARIREQALQPVQDAWQGMWERLAAALADPHSRIAYSPVDEIALIGRLYSLRDFVSGAIAAQAPSPPATDAERMRQLGVVLLAPVHADPSLRQSINAAVYDLAGAGLRVTVLDDACEGYHWSGLATWIRRGANLPDQLAWIGRTDVLCVFDERAPVWIRAKTILTFDGGDPDWPRELTTRLTVLSDPTGSGSAPARPVALLHHAIDGDATSRIVVDLASQLDRRRYIPYVLTLTEDMQPTAHPEGVAVLCVRDFIPASAHSARMSSPTAASTTVSATQPNRPQYPDLMAAFDACLPAVEGLQAVLSQLGPETALIAFREEATVAAWLAQTGRSLKFIASVDGGSTQGPTCQGSPHPWILSNACRASERLSTPSASGKQDLVSKFGIPAAHIDLRDDPIDCARIRRLSLAPCSDPNLFSEDRFTFVSIGRALSENDLELLMRACSVLAELRRDFKLLIVGTELDDADLSARIAARGLRDIVRLIERPENPFPLLRRAGTLVLISPRQADAYDLREALACGVPVLAVDWSQGLREIMANGEAGLLTAADDANALADGMLRLMTTPRLAEKLVAAAYECAINIDVRRIAREWEAAIALHLPPGHDSPTESTALARPVARGDDVTRVASH